MNTPNAHSQGAFRIGYVMQTGVPDIRSSRPSGPAVHVTQTVRELAKLGHHVRVVACLDGAIWRTDDLTNYVRVPVPLFECWPVRMAERVIRRSQAELNLPYLALFDSLRFSIACQCELAGFDLLYERMGWMGWGGSLAAARLSAPHILEVNGDHVRENEMLGLNASALQKRISIQLMRQVVSRATHTVATGEGWRRRHVEYWRVDPAKTSVVQNGSEVVDLLRRDALCCRVRNALQPGAPLRLIYVGSFDPWQDIPTLFKAVARALRLGIPVKLTLAGSGKNREALENVVRALAIGSAVTFAGHLPIAELVGQLAVADVGVCLYVGRDEFDGLKLLDYKGAGLATIAVGRGGEPAVLKNGVTGLVIPPSDEGALVRAIQELALDRPRLVRMGLQARREAEQEHRWENTAHALDRIMQTVIHAPKRNATAMRRFGEPVSYR